MKILQLVLSISLSVVTLQASAITCMTSKCHSDRATGKYVHAPLKTNNCKVCHRTLSEGAPGKHPVVERFKGAQVNQVCIICHSKERKDVVYSHFIHKAITKEGCIGCHNPHHSEHKHLLIEDLDQGKICFRCHTDRKQSFGGATHHRFESMDKGCMSCHASHASDHPKILNQSTAMAVCLRCHKDTGKGTAQVDKAPPISFAVPEGGSIHKPVKDSQCIRCHEIHGSTRPKLPAKNFTAEAYGTADEQSVGLCFSCHEQKKFNRLEVSSDETNFRNGERNLHFLHLYGSKQKRTCAVCHQVHTSAQPFLLNSIYHLYGQDISLGYKKADQGGSCANYCHKQMNYNRAEAVKNELDR